MIKTKEVNERSWWVRLTSTKEEDDVLDMDLMKDYPLEAIEYFKKRKEECGYLMSSDRYDQTVDVLINQFIQEEKITRENLIDIKFSMVSPGGEYNTITSALIIYEDKYST